MTYYTNTLNTVDSTDFTQSIMCGSHSFSLHFYYPEDIEEVAKDFRQMLTSLAKSDTLVKGLEINRDYDYLDFWLNTIPGSTFSQLEKYVTNEEGKAAWGWIPQSLSKFTGDTLYAKLQDKILEAKELQTLLEPYFTAEGWQLEVIDDEGNVALGRVQPGGWINNNSKKWELQILSPESITKDNLSDIEMQWGISDEW
jgi:hypothetical protein